MNTTTTATNFANDNSAPSHLPAVTDTLSRGELRTCEESAREFRIPLDERVRRAIAGKLEILEITLPPCPFCGESEKLDPISWSSDRSDGAEYNGPAVSCLRCFAIAPLASWLARGAGTATAPLA